MLFSLPLFLQLSVNRLRGIFQKGETKMAFCPNCGTKLEEGKRFCPNCGTQVAAPAAPQPPAFDDGPVQAQPAPEETPVAAPAPAPVDLGNKVAQLNDTPDTTAAFDPNDVAANKVYGILAYLGILVLIPIFVGKDSPFTRYHANQGLNLLILEIIFFILGKLLAFLGVIGWIIDVVLAIIGIVNAANGRAKELPIIGKFRLLK